MFLLFKVTDPFKFTLPKFLISFNTIGFTSGFKSFSYPLEEK